MEPGIWSQIRSRVFSWKILESLRLHRADNVCTMRAMNRKRKASTQPPDGRWPDFPVTPDKCLMIQWERPQIPTDDKGNPVCPKCGGPAELILGVYSQPCWAHKRTMVKS